jgi:hypothetical protein
VKLSQKVTWQAVGKTSTDVRRVLRNHFNVNNNQLNYLRTNTQIPVKTNPTQMLKSTNTSIYLHISLPNYENGLSFDLASRLRGLAPQLHH